MNFAGPLVAALLFAQMFVLQAQARLDESLGGTLPGLVSQEVIDQILSQGVPELSLKRLVAVIEGQWGNSQEQPIYHCKDQPAENLKPCHADDRTSATTQIQLRAFRYAISIDYSLSSIEPRFYFIDFETGEVEKQLVAHGLKSGDGLFATNFSNVLNSNMTSIGMHLIGGTYFGKYGETLRMYGLEASNDQAYIRDIVFHGAWYSRADFIESINKKTGAAYGRLGLSFGCPAVSPEAMARYLRFFKAEGGGYIDHFHPDFTPALESNLDL